MPAVDTDLAPLFLARLPPATAAEPAVLEPLLRGLLDAGRAAWPALPVRPEQLACHLAGLCPAGEDPHAGLLAIHYAEDLYLACACANGSDAALREFEGLYLSKVPAFVPAREATPALLSELTQELRQRLFVGRDEAPPRIASYSGRGSLLSWVRTAAVRTLLNLRRDAGRHTSPFDEERATALRDLAAEQDPEMAYIKGRYSEEFKAAFAAALTALAPEQQTLLRLSHVEELQLDQIGALLGVHRTTVHRRLVEAREQLQGQVRRLLRERLGLSQKEYDSLAGLVRSQLDMSLSRVLKKRQG